MSKYTTEVRFICENLAGKYESGGLLSLDEVLDKCIPKIFDFDYPIFDEVYRGVLERKILRHYYTREIAFETVGLWKMWLNTRLNEIMPYYNKLYETSVIEFNPSYEMDYYRKGEYNDDNSIANTGTVTNDTHDVRDVKTDDTTNNGYISVSESNGTDKVKMSDTPQGGVDGLDSDTYLTQYTKTESESNTGTGSLSNQIVDGHTKDTLDGKTTREDNTLSTIKNNRDYEEHIYGIRSSNTYVDALIKFRESILNIDVLIINELSDLFFGLW